MAGNSRSLVVLLVGFALVFAAQISAEIESDLGQIEEEPLGNRATFEIKSMKNCSNYNFSQRLLETEIFYFFVFHRRWYCRQDPHRRYRFPKACQVAGRHSTQRHIYSK